MLTTLLNISRFEELHKKGYTLDMLYILEFVSENPSVDVFTSPKLKLIQQSLVRKGLLTEEGTCTVTGKEIIEFLNSKEETKLSLSLKTKISDWFDEWWKTYPGTDTFVYKGVSFNGSRSLRVKKDECKIKLKKILDEGEYKIEELIGALQHEVMQKKENSVKTKTNKLSFMQNSLTYLNQRTFEPFIELIREGHKIQETQQIEGGTDI